MKSRRRVNSTVGRTSSKGESTCPITLTLRITSIDVTTWSRFSKIISPVPPSKTNTPRNNGSMTYATVRTKQLFGLRSRNPLARRRLTGELGKLQRANPFAKTTLCPRHRPNKLVAFAQQIVGRERRGRVSHHDWSGDACMNWRRRVNSTVSSLIYRDENHLGDPDR